MENILATYRTKCQDISAALIGSDCLRKSCRTPYTWSHTRSRSRRKKKKLDVVRFE